MYLHANPNELRRRKTLIEKKIWQLQTELEFINNMLYNISEPKSYKLQKKQVWWEINKTENVPDIWKNPVIGDTPESWNNQIGDTPESWNNYIT